MRDPSDPSPQARTAASPLAEVAFVPEDLHGMAVQGKRVVVLDVFRATSSICAGLHAGIQSFRPVLTTEESLALAAEGYIPAAEREGRLAPGFEVGNSPLAFREPPFKNAKIALTTTNGTRALLTARDLGAAEVLAGSFLGLEHLLHYLHHEPADLILLGAGWKGVFSLEDTLLAGAILAGLRKSSSAPNPVPDLSNTVYRLAGDRAQAALSLWERHRDNLEEAVRHSSHYGRLAAAGLEEDLKFCIRLNACPCFARLVNNDLRLGEELLN